MCWPVSHSTRSIPPWERVRGSSVWPHARGRSPSRQRGARAAGLDAARIALRAGATQGALDLPTRRAALPARVPRVLSTSHNGTEAFEHHTEPWITPEWKEGPTRVLAQEESIVRFWHELRGDLECTRYDHAQSSVRRSHERERKTGSRCESRGVLHEAHLSLRDAWLAPVTRFDLAATAPRWRPARRDPLGSARTRTYISRTHAIRPYVCTPHLNLVARS